MMPGAEGGAARAGRSWWQHASSSFITVRTYTIIRFSAQIARTFPAMRSSFLDRTEAGRLLADKLRAYEKHPDAIVLALPRGGVPVAYEVAIGLGLPLDV